MSQLDRRDQLPDYYADMARIPSRSAQVHKRLCWNERFKEKHLKDIEKLRNKSIINSQKEALTLYEKLSYFEDLKRNNPNEIERIEKLKEKNRLSFLMRKEEFFETIAKIEKGIFDPPIETKSDDKRLKSAIKQFRSSSSKTAKSVTFNLSANKFHHDQTNENKKGSEINITKKKSRSFSDLYRVPDDVLPELGEDIVFRNKNEYFKKKIIIDK